jgi:putative transposase
MDQRKVRISAVRRLLRGESVTSICRSLGKCRRWLYYWSHRYSPSNKRWSFDRSRAPRHQPRKVSTSAEQLVCQVRKRLLEHKYAQRGAVAIQWELRQLGVDPLPEIWTINRIIRRHKLWRKQPRTRHRPTYPKMAVSAPGVLHQLDLVGPRYLSGGIRFYGTHLIDACSNAVALEVIEAKQTEAICRALLAQWRRLGIPRFLQVDNELSFRGSNRYPRSFGLVVRLCLHAGVEIIFIPEGEPWRNGIIERFNDTYDKSFFRRQRFSSLAHLHKEAYAFEQFHNQHHRYAKLGQQPPNGIHSQPRQTKRLSHLDLGKIRRSWKDGRISFIRLTDHRGTVRFFTERFTVHPTLVHEYVLGTISTHDNRLRFYHQGRCVKVIRYFVSKNKLQLHM